MNFKIILIEMPIITKGVSQLPRESSADRFCLFSRLILIFVGCLTFKFESECRK